MITVGLASHWPCVTDNCGLSTYGLNGLCQGDEHHAYAPSGVWHSFTFLIHSLTGCVRQGSKAGKRALTGSNRTRGHFIEMLTHADHMILRFHL